MKKSQLFLLHFAGGNLYSFQFLLPHLKNLEVIPLELPGRGKRTDEELIIDADMAVKDYTAQIMERLNGQDFIIYGHSMGAVLGLLVARELELLGKAPLRLVVSGNPGPGGITEKKERHLMSQEALIEELKSLGGISQEVIDEKSIFEYFEPIIRADFAVLEKKELTISAPLKTGIFALMGSKEKSSHRITNWKQFTEGAFGFTILEGDHFFIREHPSSIAHHIIKCYDRNLVL